MSCRLKAAGQDRLDEADDLEVGADQYGGRLLQILRYNLGLRLPCPGSEDGGGRTVGGHGWEGASSSSLRRGVPFSAPLAAGHPSFLWGG